MSIALLIFAGMLGEVPDPVPGRSCLVVQNYYDYLPKIEDTRVLARVLDQRFVEVHDSTHPRFRGEARGRLIRIETGEGAATDGVASPGSEVIVFAWALGMDCKLHWAEFGVAADSLHHFTMRLRPDTAWVAGRPTFDVDIRGWRIFPGRYPDPWERPDLTVLEYAHMLSLIPGPQEWESDCRPGMKQLLDWYHVNGQPFKRVMPGLLFLCEQRVAATARSFTRQGAEVLPASIEAWATARGCRVARDSWHARPQGIPGHFVPREGTQWALLCETDADWRLLIVDPDRTEPLMELARMTGSAEGWSLSLAPPEYFEWAPIDWGPRTSEPRVPGHDAVLLGEDTVFYFDGERWTAARSECCYFPALDPPAR